MRIRFEQQLVLGQLLVEDTQTWSNSKNALDELLAALKAIYCHKGYSDVIFCILEKHINSNKKRTRRRGMNLWTIFVFAQVRLCLNKSYDVLHNLANNHLSLRQIAGIEMESDRLKYCAKKYHICNIKFYFLTLAIIIF